MFWTSRGDTSISGADLDGSADEDIVTVALVVACDILALPQISQGVQGVASNATTAKESRLHILRLIRLAKTILESQECSSAHSRIRGERKWQS